MRTRGSNNSGNLGILFLEHFSFTLASLTSHNVAEFLSKAFGRPDTVFTIICPWILKVFPNMANHKTNKAGYADVVTMMRELIEGHKETHDKNHPRDFIDCYLTEILKTDNPQSSFYKETGEDNLTTLLIDLFVVRAANSHLLYFDK